MINRETRALVVGNGKKNEIKNSTSSLGGRRERVKKKRGKNRGQACRERNHTYLGAPKKYTR